MSKPLLLYLPIYDDVAESFVNQMNEVPNDQDLEIWINSPGGRVFAGWAIIGPMQKREGKIKTCVFGNASSMAAYIPLYSDYTEALEVTQFVLHRADGYVSNPEDQEFLDAINSDLRKQMEKRLDLEIFTKITGKTMDQMFDPKSRIDIVLSAKNAKKVGLINEIIKLNPKEIESMSKHFVAFADFSQRSENEDTQRSEQKPESNNNNQIKVKKMTRLEFKASNAEDFAAIMAEGQTLGEKNERERAKAWLAFLDIDKENVVKAIKEGTEFTSSVMAEMAVKMNSKNTVEAITKDSPDAVKTTEIVTEKTAAQKAVEAEEKMVIESLKKVKPI